MFWNLSETPPVDIGRSYQLLEGLIPEFRWNANALIALRDAYIVD